MSGHGTVAGLPAGEMETSSAAWKEWLLTAKLRGNFVSSSAPCESQMHRDASLGSLHPAYFETRFRISQAGVLWPHQFAILSAYATTGQIWSTEINQSADRQMAERIKQSGLWHQRVIGFSPTTGHAEPSWCLEVAFDVACEWGLEYLQDAIYYVEEDRLFVSHCDERRQRVSAGSFRQRIVWYEDKDSPTHDQR